MPSKMLLEWRAFCELEPFGDMRADFRVGQLTAVVANALKPKNAKPFRWTDFTIGGGDSGKATGDDMCPFVKQLHAIFSAAWGD